MDNFLSLFSMYIGMTALHHASAEGVSSIVEMLIHYGANVNDKDQHGKFTYDCMYGKESFL